MFLLKIINPLKWKVIWRGGLFRWGRQKYSEGREVVGAKGREAGGEGEVSMGRGKVNGVLDPLSSPTSMDIRFTKSFNKANISSLHKSLEDSSCHVTPKQYVLDQGSTPKFHMDLTWRHLGIYTGTLAIAYRSSGKFVLQCVVKFRNAMHKSISFLVNRISWRDGEFDTREKSRAYTI